LPLNPTTHKQIQQQKQNNTNSQAAAADGPIGHLPKNHHTGALAALFDAKLAAAGAPLADAGAGLAELFGVKDAAELINAKKAAFLAAKVMGHAVEKIEEAIDQEKAVKHSKLSGARGLWARAFFGGGGCIVHTACARAQGGGVSQIKSNTSNLTFLKQHSAHTTTNQPPITTITTKNKQRAHRGRRHRADQDRRQAARRKLRHRLPARGAVGRPLRPQAVGRERRRGARAGGRRLGRVGRALRELLRQRRAVRFLVLVAVLVVALLVLCVFPFHF
jgi:hypothetical protein